MTNKKLELQTFLDLTRDNQIKVVLYIVGALVLMMVGLSSLSGGNLDAVSGIIAGCGIGGGSWLGYKGYTVLIDPKNEKTCNSAFWTVTENVDFDPDDYTENEKDITLCKAQIKAQYDQYAGFYCRPNTETTNTVDVYYIPLTESKKHTIKRSGTTSNVFTIKSDIKITEPPGTFTLEFVNSSSSFRGSSFIRIDETRNVNVNMNVASSPQPDQQSFSVQQLKDGIPISVAQVNSISVTAFSKSGEPVTRTITMSSPSASSPS